MDDIKRDKIIIKRNTMDLIRQQKIIKILKPNKFWRYDSKNKTWNDILERRD